MPASQKIETTHLFESILCHILYYSQEADAYVSHAADILMGIRLGKHTIIMENGRFQCLIETWNKERCFASMI